MTLPKTSKTKKVNLDFNKEFISTFSQNIESRNTDFINQTLKDLHDADVYELSAWIPLVILTVLIGVFPKLIFGATNDAVIAMLSKAFGG